MESQWEGMRYNWNSASSRQQETNEVKLYSHIDLDYNIENKSQYFPVGLNICIPLMSICEQKQDGARAKDGDVALYD